MGQIKNIKLHIVTDIKKSEGLDKNPKNTMDRITAMVVSFLFLSCFLSIVANAAEAEEVKIDVLSKPEACDIIAKNGDTISMKYKGNLYDVTTKEIGKEFDSNHDRPGTFDFKLGAGQVIQGWEKGIPGMCVGEKRKLTIPPQLAYGDAGFSDLIPPKSTLVFEIELVDTKAGSDAQDHPHDHEGDSFAAIDTNGDKQITSEEMAAYIKKFNEEGSEADKFDNIDTIVGEIFQEDDKNKDGVISLDEYQQFEDGYDGEMEHQMEEEDNADAAGASDDDEDEDEADAQRDEL